MADTHNEYSDDWFYVSLGVSILTILGVSVIDARYLANDDDPSVQDDGQPVRQPVRMMFQYGLTF